MPALLEVGIDVSQLRGVSGQFRRAALHIKSLASKLLDDAAQILLEETRRQAPRDTGRLRDSLRLQSAGRLTRTVASDVPYAHYVIRGTRPHLIRPRRRKALWWPDAPHPLAKVLHPGTRPNPFPERGVDEAMPRIESRLRGFADAVVAEVTR